VETDTKNDGHIRPSQSFSSFSSSFSPLSHPYFPPCLSSFSLPLRSPSHSYPCSLFLFFFISSTFFSTFPFSSPANSLLKDIKLVDLKLDLRVAESRSKICDVKAARIKWKFQSNGTNAKDMG